MKFQTVTNISLAISSYYAVIRISEVIPCQTIEQFWKSSLSPTLPKYQMPIRKYVRKNIEMNVCAVLTAYIIRGVERISEEAQ